MESKIKELLTPYFYARNIDDNDFVNESVVYVKGVLFIKDIYDIGSHLDAWYLRHVDFDLLKGLESIKKEFQK
jgi:hypothetical protein